MSSTLLFSKNSEKGKPETKRYRRPVRVAGKQSGTVRV
jgi:hypothetical protein